MMNKIRNNYLMRLADESLHDKDDMLKNGAIQESYNGQVAALGFTISMSGLLPALSIYYQEGSVSREVKRSVILDVIARMINKDEYADIFKNISDAKSLLRTAIDNQANEKNFKMLQKEVEDCSIALKQVVRTYKLMKNEKSK